MPRIARAVNVTYSLIYKKVGIILFSLFRYRFFFSLLQNQRVGYSSNIHEYFVSIKKQAIAEII